MHFLCFLPKYSISTFLAFELSIQISMQTYKHKPQCLGILKLYQNVTLQLEYCMSKKLWIHFKST